MSLRMFAVHVAAPLGRRDRGVVPRMLCVALLLALARCGDLPRPFAGRPGSMALQLAQPPPSRLVITPPSNAMLSDIGADTLAGALTAALVEREVPAVEDAPRKGDWSLSLSADLQNGQIVPSYQVMDPTGKQMGVTLGKPIDSAAWSAAAPATLRDAAGAAAPAIVAMLHNIDAAQQKSDPNSLLNRPARIAVGPVTGAPGDGNISLVRQMKLELPKLGEVIADSPAGADFTVGAEVAVAEGAKGTQRIEIQWSVADARGDDLGRVVQLNEIAPGSLDHFWGDVAAVVAQEAAGGVKNVIQNELNARAGKTVAKAADAPPEGAAAAKLSPGASATASSPLSQPPPPAMAAAPPGAAPAVSGRALAAPGQAKPPNAARQRAAAADPNNADDPAPTIPSGTMAATAAPTGERPRPDKSGTPRVRDATQPDAQASAFRPVGHAALTTAEKPAATVGPRKNPIAGRPATQPDANKAFDPDAPPPPPPSVAPVTTAATANSAVPAADQPKVATDGPRKTPLARRAAMQPDPNKAFDPDAPPPSPPSVASVTTTATSAVQAAERPKAPTGGPRKTPTAGRADRQPDPNKAYDPAAPAPLVATAAKPAAPQAVEPPKQRKAEALVAQGKSSPRRRTATQSDLDKAFDPDAIRAEAPPADKMPPSPPLGHQ